MKTIIITLVALVFSAFSFAQTVSYKGSGEDVKKGVEKGEFVFVFDAGASAEEINKNANYYTDYFNVAFNDETKTAIITMVDNSEMGRRVITRFLLSNGIKSVALDGQEHTLNDFYDKYLK
jgi:hypothetical protein